MQPIILQPPVRRTLWSYFLFSAYCANAHVLRTSRLWSNTAGSKVRKQHPSHKELILIAFINAWAFTRKVSAMCYVATTSKYVLCVYK